MDRSALGRGRYAEYSHIDYSLSSVLRWLKIIYKKDLVTRKASFVLAKQRYKVLILPEKPLSPRNLGSGQTNYCFRGIQLPSTTV